MASERLKKFARGVKQKSRSQSRDKKGAMAPLERKALWKMRIEARKAGTLLKEYGRGGLPASLVYGVMRRDGFHCKVCGELGSKENGGLSIHHKAQHIRDPKVQKKGVLANEEGRRNDPSQMIAICDRCHDNVHEEDRDENPGKPDADEEMHGEQPAN